MSQLTDAHIAIIKGMIMRGDQQQKIVACFGGVFNSGRIAEIAHSVNRLHSDDDGPLTKRARDITAQTYDLPPPPPYPSPYEILRARAALRTSAMALRGLIEKAQSTLAMMERSLDE